MSEIEISEKFQPLFELLLGKYPDVDTVIMTGGRYSLKSYTVSIFANTALAYYGWNILYTRYTNSTIIDSIKPEVSDKIELLGLEGILKDTNTHIEYDGNRISFKGIKPGAKAQTANLKSLSGFNCFINDEAEELPDLKTFKKIFYSIRDTKKRNLSILILNPTTREHWIFEEFFEKKGLSGGDNCIKDNVMYIHTSYLDASFSKMPKNILADYERMKVDSPTDYENIVLGGWIEELDGLIFPKSSLKRYTEFPENVEYFTIAFADTADEGNDNFAMPIARVYNERVYIIDAIFDQQNLTIQEGQVTSMVKLHGIGELIVETNSFGAYFKRRIQELIPHLNIYGQNAKSNKIARILSMSGIIKHFFYFPENPNETTERFIKQVTSIMKTSKDNDDAPDSLSGLAAHLEKFYQIFNCE